MSFLKSLFGIFGKGDPTASRQAQSTAEHPNTSTLVASLQGTAPSQTGCSDPVLDTLFDAVYRGATAPEVTDLLAQHPSLASARQNGAAGMTCLHVAALRGHWHLVRPLLANGADVNATTRRDNSTPLHLAVEGTRVDSKNQAYVEVVRRLLENGADRNIKDRNGKTAMDACPANGLVAAQIAAVLDHCEVKRTTRLSPTTATWTAHVRPLGNRKRLTSTPQDDSYDAMLLLFASRDAAEGYYDLLTEFARATPPPFVIETMVFFKPELEFAEKYAVVVPNDRVDTRPEYAAWITEALGHCNNTVRPRKVTDQQYKTLHRSTGAVIKWDVFLPAKFSETSDEARQLLFDELNGGFEPLRMQGQEGVPPLPEKPDPNGPWIGVLFNIACFSESLYGEAATARLLEIIGERDLAGCVVHGGDILPECQYWCSAVHASSPEQAQRIQHAARTSNDAHLAPVGSRILTGSGVPIRTLPYQGFVSKGGQYIGKVGLVTSKKTGSASPAAPTSPLVTSEIKKPNVEIDVIIKSIREGTCDDARRLIETSGVDINSRGPSGMTLLCHAAASKGKAPLAEWMIQHGADVVQGNVKKQSPLHLAAAYGNLETADLLLRSGAPVNALDDQACTPMDVAEAAKHPEVMTLFLSVGGRITP